MKKRLSIFLATVAMPLMVIADDIDVMPWAMYQQNASHTGYVNTKVNPTDFLVDWKVSIGDIPKEGVYDLFHR